MQNSNLLKACSSPFLIERNQKIIGTTLGFFNSNSSSNTIQIIENSNIKTGDWLIEDTSQNRYYVENIYPIGISGKLQHFIVNYQTQKEYEYRETITNHSNNTFNIQSVNGNAVFGNTISGSGGNINHYTKNSLSEIEKFISSLPLSEQEEANQLLAELQEMESSENEALENGKLAKFSMFLKKHQKLFALIGEWAVSHLIGN